LNARAKSIIEVVLAYKGADSSRWRDKRDEDKADKKGIINFFLVTSHSNT
jgi:hypothetical protein